MRLRFLCPTHRSLVEQSHSQALYVWQLSREKALRFCAHGRQEQSIAAAGSALEVADLLLTLHNRAGAQDIVRFGQSATLLLNLMDELGKPELTRRLLNGCVARLEAMIASGADASMILGCCQHLMQRDEQPSAPLHNTARQSVNQIENQAGERVLH